MCLRILWNSSYIKNHLEINAENIIKKIGLSKKIIGIGESGLDFYYNHLKKRSNQIF